MSAWKSQCMYGEKSLSARCCWIDCPLDHSDGSFGSIQLRMEVKSELLKWLTICVSLDTTHLRACLRKQAAPCQDIGLFRLICTNNMFKRYWLRTGNLVSVNIFKFHSTIDSWSPGGVVPRGLGLVPLTIIQNSSTIGMGT